jgi:hypothetical protein
MKNTYFKRTQRAINKVIRAVNKQIAEDRLFNGRFVMHQFNRHTYEYPDHSGYNYNVFVEVTDKVTGRTEQYPAIWVIYYFNDEDRACEGLSRLTISKFWDIMNDFITMKSGFWQERNKI